LSFRAERSEVEESAVPSLRKNTADPSTAVATATFARDDKFIGDFWIVAFDAALP
jgi:hypothetical protein